MLDIIAFSGVLIFSILIVQNEGKLPADIKPCKAGDTNCIVETINKIIETKYEGDPVLNLIPIDPLKISKMEVKRSKDSAVNVRLEIRNSEVIGYKNFRAYKVRGFGASPGGKHEVYLKGPFAILVGDYTIDGKILILPVQGVGRSNITMDEIFLKINIHADEKDKNGETYMDVKNAKLNLNTTRFHIELTNLFNGDVELGDTLNKFINENWHDVYVDLKQPVLDAFGVVFTDFLRKLFDAHPYKELVEGGK